MNYDFDFEHFILLIVKSELADSQIRVGQNNLDYNSPGDGL